VTDQPLDAGDERHLPGMPVLHRQPVREPRLDSTSTLPPSLQRLPARSVPETRPTPLQKHFINLSVVALICGAVAITALNMGARFGDPLIKLCVIVASPILFATSADATLRIWRSAWAWMPVNRGRGLFRLAWVAASITLLAILALATWVVLTA
jgi:hypothetical protein